MQIEKKIVRVTMIILFLTLILVYIIFYNSKQEIISEKISKLTTIIYTGTQNIPITSEDDNFSSGKNIFSGTLIEKTTGNNNIIKTGDALKNIFGNTNETTGKNELKSGSGIQDIPLLSGTQMYYGEFSLANSLSINPLYILYDPKGIYYAYLGDEEKDRKAIARINKGSIVELRKKEDLLKNKLFGDKVIFINIPKYKNKEVIMIITIDKEQRLINIPFGIYHKSKDHIKSVFNF